LLSVSARICGSEEDSEALAYQSHKFSKWPEILNLGPFAFLKGLFVGVIIVCVKFENVSKS